MEERNVVGWRCLRPQDIAAHSRKKCSIIKLGPPGSPLFPLTECAHRDFLGERSSLWRREPAFRSSSSRQGLLRLRAIKRNDSLSKREKYNCSFPRCNRFDRRPHRWRWNLTRRWFSNFLSQLSHMNLAQPGCLDVFTSSCVFSTV